MATSALHTIAIVAMLMVIAPVETIMTVKNADEKHRPVSKVIALLKDMSQKLEKQLAEDEESYDKMSCWCQTNDKEKTKAVADAQLRISDLTMQVEELASTIARLDTEIENNKKEVEKSQQTLDEATSMREKQASQFTSEEKDLMESVSALRTAIAVLSKHHPGAMLQLPRIQMISIAATLQNEIQKHAVLLKGVLTPSERKAVAGFAQVAQPTFKQAYVPQSSEIFGILKQMLATFTADLSQSQEQELTNRNTFSDLKVAKQAEIAAANEQLFAKTQRLAKASEDSALAKQDIEDTTASLTADDKFLLMLKEKCQLTDQQWEERQKTRRLEIKAVSQSIAILSSDDAHDLFTRTFNPASFVQWKQLAQSGRQTKASEMLSAASHRMHSHRLAALAIQMRLDAFTRVKKAIDDMIVQLLKEKEEEIKHRSLCISELNSNELETQKKEREKADSGMIMQELETSIKELTVAIDEMKAEIAEMNVQVKHGGEDREKENEAFKLTINDQRKAQALLRQAHTYLANYYKEAISASEAALLQGTQPEAPAGFNTYAKNGGGAAVLGLLEQIMDDAKVMEEETIRAEENAQNLYDNVVSDTAGSIELKNKDIINKSAEKATKEQQYMNAKSKQDSALLELEQLSNKNGELHLSCDFVSKNFDIRQTARDEEVEALREAKAILSGANLTTSM